MGARIEIGRALGRFWSPEPQAEALSTTAPWTAESTRDDFETALPERYTAETLLRRFQELGSEQHLPAIRATELESLSVSQRRMFSATLSELKALQRNTINTAEYMFRVMQHAADLSGGNSEQFVNFIQMVFSAPPSMKRGPISVGFTNEQERRLLAGAGAHTPGWWLEAMHRRIPGRAEAQRRDFNPLVLDDQNKFGSITHHFGELLKVGYRRPKSLANAVVTVLDDPRKAPGDVRCGYFAVMVGQALKDGALSPDEAVKLTRISFEAGHASAPWGDDARADNAAERPRWFRLKQDVSTGFLNPKRYDIALWREHLNAS